MVPSERLLLPEDLEYALGDIITASKLCWDIGRSLDSEERRSLHPYWPADPPLARVKKGEKKHEDDDESVTAALQAGALAGRHFCLTERRLK